MRIRHDGFISIVSDQQLKPSLMAMVDGFECKFEGLPFRLKGFLEDYCA